MRQSELSVIFVGDCVPQQECESFQAEKTRAREIVSELGKGSEEYQEILTKLQSSVCNAQKKYVCCEKDKDTIENEEKADNIFTGDPSRQNYRFNGGKCFCGQRKDSTIQVIYELLILDPLL